MRLTHQVFRPIQHRRGSFKLAKSAFDEAASISCLPASNIPGFGLRAHAPSQGAYGENKSNPDEHLDLRVVIFVLFLNVYHLN